MQRDELLTVNEVAERLRVGRGVVVRLIRSGKLDAINVGGGDVKPRWRVSRKVVDRFLKIREPADVIEFY